MFLDCCQGARSSSHPVCCALRCGALPCAIEAVRRGMGLLIGLQFTACRTGWTDNTGGDGHKLQLTVLDCRHRRQYVSPGVNGAAW